MNRRDFIALIAVEAAAPSHFAYAQQRPAKTARIGFLNAASASAPGYAGRVDALRTGLRDLGYLEGRNLIIEYRWAEGNYARLPALALELVQSKVDVMVASPAPATRAAQQATTTIPIVVVAAGDPVASGFVKSLSQPGGNITGLANIIVDLSSKYLELLRLAVPKLSRVFVLTNPGHPNHPDYLKNIQAAATTNGVRITPVEAGTPTQIEDVLTSVSRERASALIVLADPFFQIQAPRIAELAAKGRVPTMFWTRELAEGGGLMSYGHDIAEQFRRAATYIDKILKGAKPGDLPVEQPTKIELVINLKTAKAIGLVMPQSLLLQADKVIE